MKPSPVTHPAGNPIAARAVERAGLSLWQHDGAWLTDDDPAAVQALLDGHDPLPELRAEAVRRIKEEARRRILAVAPEWKQANATARAVELLTLRQAGRGPTPAEDAEAEALEALWVAIKAIREASDRLEAGILADADPYALLAFDPGRAAGWP